MRIREVMRRIKMRIDPRVRSQMRRPLIALYRDAAQGLIDRNLVESIAQRRYDELEDEEMSDVRIN
ncbi:hypothetical protein J7M22_02885 [Candidatus Poribacteria bacterium]|nr:hypothetical protein [Candidatus Poribacteria bacterium]